MIETLKFLFLSSLEDNVCRKSSTETATARKWEICKSFENRALLTNHIIIFIICIELKETYLD